jgi:LmbE family N-acetylglucosaminyl deacetylase
MNHEPAVLFNGIILVAAPHMDDEVLACGGTIARFPQKDRIHLIYATDGSRSPVPSCPWMGKPAPDLAQIRMQEAREAMAVLGVPEKNLRFLGLEDGQLDRHSRELVSMMSRAIVETKPDQIFIPFRYDRHPDHLALTRATLNALHILEYDAHVYEYFVYYRFRFLSGGDIRRFIRPELLSSVDIRPFSSRKKEALLRYRSQTTCLYGWQRRPILPQERVEEVSNSPEVFLTYDLVYPGPSVFASAAHWIRVVHRVEPWLKQTKEHMLALFRQRKMADGRRP